MPCLQQPRKTATELYHSLVKDDNAAGDDEEEDDYDETDSEDENFGEVDSDDSDDDSDDGDVEPNPDEHDSGEYLIDYLPNIS